MMEFINHRTIFSRLTKLFILFGLFLIVIAALITYFLQGKVNEYELNAKSQLVSKYKQHEYLQYIEESKNIITSLKQNHHFQRYLSNQEKKTVSEELFLTVAQGNNKVLQIRYLDALGVEKIRINQTNNAVEYYKVEPPQLQDKSKRYYFQEIKRLLKDDIYISKLDLNIENGQIEVPYVPTLRVATPVYVEGKFKGAIILNLKMQSVLNSVVNSDIFNIYLLNNNNEVIYSNDETQMNWSTVLELSSIVPNKSLIRKEILFENNSERVYIGLKAKKTVSYQLINYSVLILILILIPTCIIFAYLLRRKVHFIFNKFEEQNRYAIQQVKLESIGKLLENIAHQWRQPLNVISSLSSSSKMMLQMELLKTNELYQNLDQITTTCIGLSHTIDDFKNFFKMDASISSFRLLDLKERALEQLEDDLNKNEIVFITDKKSVNLKMKGSRQTLEHILMVLIRNAIDAHLCHDVQNRYIFFATEVNKESIIIKIKDNALGIDETLIEQIFEPYFTTHKELEGKGMGLYIVHQIITQQLGGQIEVRNVEYKYKQLLCQGAEFQIILPLKK